MDTSKEYIKMCDNPEIQKLWVKPAWGDFFNDSDGLTYTCISIKNTLKYMKEHIWLPRQDQLQDMVKYDSQGDEMDAYSLIGWFNHYLENTVPAYPTVKTPEQLWLTFVMKELYNKTWDGKKWKTLPEGE